MDIILKIQKLVNTGLIDAENGDMGKHVNFEDNIFVLNIRIRMIRDLLILDTDAVLFLDKTMDDLVFIHNCLDNLFSSLKENKRLIERDEQFHNLAQTEQKLNEVLAKIEQGDGAISVRHYPELREQITFLLSQCHERQHSIQDLLANSQHPVPEPVVSHDELHELLSS